jgi:hypothetical protein
MTATNFSYSAILPTLIEVQQSIAQATLPPIVATMINNAAGALGSPPVGQSYVVAAFGSYVLMGGTEEPVALTLSVGFGGTATDVRELILERILAIVTGLPGIVMASRNRLELSGSNRPAAILHDGVEQESSQDGLAPPPRGSLKQFMMLEPRIQILVGVSSDTIGSTISTFRAALLPAILNDVTLQQLCGGPSGVRGQTTMMYLGSTLETVGGATTEATMEFNFRFQYVLNIADLAS